MDDIDGDLQTESVIHNPFDADTTDTLHLPQFSPSVFSRTKSPSQKSCSASPFQWSIDNIAILQPADIDETSHQESVRIDTEVEEKAQKAIDQFFSQKHVVPSPWSDPKEMKHVTFSPNPPSTRYYKDNIGDSYMDSPKHTSTLERPKTSEVCCQTALSFPPEFDLQEIIGGEFYTKCDNDMDVICMSSLRRKLFFQGDYSSPPSPVKSTHNSQLSTPSCPGRSPPLSPTSSRKPGIVQGEQSPTKTPMSNQFSSSPIQDKISPHLTPLCPARSSISSVALDTPALSPIARPILKTPSTGNSGSSCNSKTLLTPFAFRSECTPSTDGEIPRHVLLDSPQLSPIVTDVSQTRCHKSRITGRIYTPVKTLHFPTDEGQTRVKTPTELPAVGCHSDTSPEEHHVQSTDYTDGHSSQDINVDKENYPTAVTEFHSMNTDMREHVQGRTESQSGYSQYPTEFATESNTRQGNGVLHDFTMGEISTQLDSNAYTDSGFNTQSNMDIEVTNCETTDYCSMSCDNALNISGSKAENVSCDSDFSSSSIDMSIIQTDIEKRRMTTGDSVKPRHRGQRSMSVESSEGEMDRSAFLEMPDVGITQDENILLQPQVFTDKTNMIYMSSPSPYLNKFYNFSTQRQSPYKYPSPRIINHNSMGLPQFPWKQMSSRRLSTNAFQPFSPREMNFKHS